MPTDILQGDVLFTDPLTSITPDSPRFSVAVSVEVPVVDSPLFYDALTSNALDPTRTVTVTVGGGAVFSATGLRWPPR